MLSHLAQDLGLGLSRRLPATASLGRAGVILSAGAGTIISA